MDDVETATRALDALVSAYDAAVGAIDRIGDRQRAFEVATALGGRLEGLRNAAARLRAEIAAEIYQVEALSLAGLARRIGVSRGRAQDLVEAARASNTEGGN